MDRFYVDLFRKVMLREMEECVQRVWGSPTGKARYWFRAFFLRGDQLAFEKPRWMGAFLPSEGPISLI